MNQTTPSRSGSPLPSLLAPWQRGLLIVGVALAAFMLANTIYLLLNRLADAVGWRFFAVGETDLPALFQAMVLSHTGVGLLLALLMLAFFLVHLPTVWKRRHRESVVSGVFFVGTGLVLVVSGLFILTAAASEANRWAWWAHVAAAALVPVGYVLHRLVSYARPPGERFRRFGLVVLGLTGLLVAWHGLTRPGQRASAEPPRVSPAGAEPAAGARARQPGAYLDSAFVPAGFVPPESPFFPSAATTTSGVHLSDRFLLPGEEHAPERQVRREVAERGFAVDAPVGARSCVRCHPDVVEQWKASAHRFASFNNPFYEATIDEMRATADAPNPWVEQHLARFPGRVEGVARAKSKWCGGCHDPALMLTGEMGRPVDRASAAAQAGLGCLACHAIDTVHGVTGNGNYNVADLQEDPYLFAGDAPGTLGAFLHDAALRARPTVHRRRMLKPFFREATYCAACHKVSLREPVNNYRWLRGQDEYDAWHNSGVARNAARTFYLPSEVRTCQECHMPRVPAPRGDVAARSGTVRSHRFPAANTALPHVRGDTATLRRVEAFLRDDRLRVDLFAVRRTSATGSGRGEPPEPISPLDVERPVLRPGERLTLDVVVRNLGVGHTFPGGTNDSNEGWLEVSVFDGEGRLLARSGAVGDDGHLDPMAHAYKAVLLDGHGRRIDRRNAHDIHVAAASNVIDPGTADVAHYELSVPPEAAGGRLVVRARLLWRKFDRSYTTFAYRSNPEGFSRFDDVPDLPITEIAADEVVLSVGQDARPPRALSAGDRAARAEGTERERGNGGAGTPTWIRYNDYGIGLLLQGHTRLARRAFLRVAELAPERIDGPLNLARTALRDGDLEEAYRRLQEAEAVRTGDARAAWVWGRVLREDGRYEDAAGAFRRVLEDFPEDREAWRNLGRVLYLDQRFGEALEALDRVLEIDPEDRIAHYYRMLCLRAAGREREAETAEAAFEYYRVDESARALTRAYRESHPGVNLMAQPIHTHELRPVPAGGADVPDE